MRNKPYKTKKIVRAVVDANPFASDEAIFCRVCEIVAPIIKCPYKLHEMSIFFFMENYRRLGFPPYESVSRNIRRYVRRFK